MGLVSAGVRQCELEGRNQLDVERVVAQVVHLDLAELDVVLGADPDRRVRLHAGPLCIEADPVSVKQTLVLRRRIGRRMLGQGHHRRTVDARNFGAAPVKPANPALAHRGVGRSALGGVGPAKVEKAAHGIAKRVVAPAGDAGGAPTAPAGAVGTQRDAVAPVAQQVGRFDGAGARQHLAQQAGRAPLHVLQRCGGRRGAQHRHLARRALVQQRGHGGQLCIGHAPTLGQAAQQQVGNGHDAHALVVRHEGGHWRKSLVTGLAAGREVQRLDETVAAHRSERGQGVQVQAGAVWRDHQRQRAGVGRQHQFVRWRAAQGKPRHPLRCVLVGQRVVGAGIGRL